MGTLDYLVLLFLCFSILCVSFLNLMKTGKAIGILSDSKKEQAIDIIFEYCHNGAVLELNGKPWHIACFPVSTE